ncbi:MAG TPA: protein DpdJ, partial [Longimicrobium sp.]|nr:protein DpdJ [Longimicrobium sp.]
MRPRSYWTKAIALYPRNELLKDQLAETYAQARKVDGVLRDAGTRKLLVGAYFGPTPYTASETDRVLLDKWARQGDGFACPYLRCPRCGKTLVWSRGDLRAGRERLKCADASCGTIVPHDEVVLTRDRMRSEPPDVLFTTTETLNIRMTDAESRHVFGIGTDRAPRLVLLDEVHTYAGVHGAQVAYVLRRWRRATGRVPVQFTGLSATLPNATEFFAQLVGLPADAVEAVEPFRDEMEDEGMEYLLALRGDPASGTALLSTTIQATMLLRRVQDVARTPEADQAAGTRVFVFADDLDVTNRLYHNLLDAEGLTGGIYPRPKPGVEPLAALRAHRALPAHREADPGERLAAGQSWYMAEQIGHVLHPARPLRVGRTTSQDAGVGQDLDVVVATASLEVGYNDPAVGAVVQHKAPREVAAFLQRKGRAGRDRKMRPWTVVILSDFGRDRAAYQSYDQLFDPSVETRTLPVGNRHVLRMQAAFALMDWIAARAPGHLPPGSVWRDFSKPGYSREERRRQGWEADLIRTLLADADPAVQRSLEEYLAAALQVAPDEVRALMWEPPRALMTSVLPTLLRRLEQRWGQDSAVGAAAVEPYRSSRPLPEFVPENLFSDLNLPEVVVETPPAKAGGDPESWPMPVLQAMRTLAPGRVTRRFAPYRPSVSHWVPLPTLAPGDHDLRVGDFCAEYEELGPVQVSDGADARELPCYRPWTVRAAEVPREVGVTSNAFLDWCSQLSPADEGVGFEIPPGGWETVLAEVRFFV